MVKARRTRLESDAAHIAGETGVRREGHAMSRRFERSRQRHHRVEMTVAYDAREQDPHWAVQPPSTVRTLPVTIPARGEAR